MLCTDLILRIMIVLSGMVLTLGFPAENPPFLKMFDSQQSKEYLSCPVCKTRNTRQQYKTLQYLNPIFIKSENALGKYEQKEKELKKFYQGFWHLTNYQRNYQEPSNFACSSFKQIRQKVSKFEKEIRRRRKYLDKLIKLEKSRSLKKLGYDEGRLKLLREFRAEIKNLLVELRHSKRIKRGKNNSRNKSLTRNMLKEAATENLRRIKSQTKIRLEEWNLLSDLKIVLQNWTMSLKNTIECM